MTLPNIGQVVLNLFPLGRTPSFFVLEFRVFKVLFVRWLT